jgi:replicative DNA helicase
VDYLQLLEDVEKNENRVQELSRITRSLKKMARELNVPVIVLSQLSRNVETRMNKRPMLSDLRESGSIEQDADVVIMLYRDEYYNNNTDEKNIIEVILAKQRNGPVGTVKLHFDPKRLNFENNVI